MGSGVGVINVIASIVIPKLQRGEWVCSQCIYILICVILNTHTIYYIYEYIVQCIETKLHTSDHGEEIKKRFWRISERRIRNEKQIIIIETIETLWSAVKHPMDLTIIIIASIIIIMMHLIIISIECFSSFLISLGSRFWFVQLDLMNMKIDYLLS